MNKCHFIGIGGIGMSALARLMLKKQVVVTGSDVIQSPITKRLETEGATVFIGHKQGNIQAADTVVYSSGISKDNPEFLEAVEKKCRLLHRSDLLKLLMDEYKTLAVAGTHGKTTTSALLASVLKVAELNPSYAIGGTLARTGVNSSLGEGEYFIAEADESDGSFLKYHPWGAILTNISADHMDYFGAIETLIAAFQTFVDQVKNQDLFFWCGDDPKLQAISPKGLSYGFNKRNKLRIVQYIQDKWRSAIDIKFKGRIYNDIQLNLIGKHNALNAAAVFGLALQLGVSESKIRQGLSEFEGVARRCEKVGSKNEVLFIDDYAHHPEEIATTLNGIRKAVKEKRLIIIYQPHRYSRTKDCLGKYKEVFKEADKTIITDIYSAGEKPIEDITVEKIVDEVRSDGTLEVKYIPYDQLVEELLAQIRPHDVVVTMGAGNITSLSHYIIDKMNQNPIQKWKVGLLFGGKTAEHEISVRSAKFFHHHLNQANYEVEYFGITKEDNWLDAEQSLSQLTAKKSLERGEPISVKVFERLISCDILLPIMHGPYGEDGTIQGFFEVLGKAYVGCGHRAAAVTMDKALTKRIILLNGIATNHFVDFNCHQWRDDPEHILQLIYQQLHFPLFVKPAHLGSTIGVAQVFNRKELQNAIDSAFKYDYKVLVENKIVGREVEFAVYGNDEVTVLTPAEIVKRQEVHDYRSKYEPNASSLNFEIEVPQEVLQEGIFLAEKAYQACQCSGLARVDFFLDEQNRYWFGEINPMPGFTDSSMYKQALEHDQVDPSTFIDQLICLGFQRKRSQQNSLLTT